MAKATHEARCPKCDRICLMRTDGYTRTHNTIWHERCPGGKPDPKTIVDLTPEFSGPARTKKRVWTAHEQRRRPAAI